MSPQYRFVPGSRNASAATFLICEYCAGGSIGDLVARDGPLPTDQAVSFALQALDGLAYAQTARLPSGSVGLVHRNIGPANILLARSGRDLVAKLAGFGLARGLDDGELFMVGEVGSPGGLMSRQHIVNFLEARPDVDVWSMAATLYFMLTGQQPRRFPEGVDPLAVILDTAAVPIRERDPHIPQRLAEVIDEALIDNPRIRITSAAELAAALRKAI
jgi:eukaryotic-like serine/threonine-protein kinase